MTNKGAAAKSETRQIVLKEIETTWGKFSEQDLSALKNKDDLVTQLVAKYGREKSQLARRAVASLRSGSGLLWTSPLLTRFNRTLSRFGNRPPTTPRDCTPKFGRAQSLDTVRQAEAIP